MDFNTFRLCRFFAAPLDVTLCCNCTSEGSDGKGCSLTCVGRGFKSILEPLRPFPLLPQPFKSNAIWQGVCFSVAVFELVTGSVTNGGVNSCWKMMSQPHTASLKSYFLQSVFVSPPPPFAEADPLIRHTHINSAVWNSFIVTGLISVSESFYQALCLMLHLFLLSALYVFSPYNTFVYFTSYTWVQLFSSCDSKSHVISHVKSLL